VDKAINNEKVQQIAHFAENTGRNIYQFTDGQAHEALMRAGDYQHEAAWMLAMLVVLATVWKFSKGNLENKWDDTISYLDSEKDEHTQIILPDLPQLQEESLDSMPRHSYYEDTSLILFQERPALKHEIPPLENAAWHAQQR
jgi:hypothetical protein